MKQITVTLTFLAALWLVLMQWRADADQALALTGGRPSATTSQTFSPDGLSIDFGAKEAWPNIEWSCPDAGGWDWSRFHAAVFTIANPSSRDVAFHIKFEDHDSAGSRHSETFSGMAAAGRTSKFFVSLVPRSVQQRSGMRALPYTADASWGTNLGAGLEPSHIDSFQIFLATPSSPQSLVVKSIVLTGQATSDDLSGLIDKYGQYTRCDWPGKIHSDSDFLRQKNVESAENRLEKSGGLDRWGGWLTGPKVATTGFFRTQRVGTRWWLVDPDGRLFLSMGVDVIRPSLSTRVKGRQAMFTGLPSPTDPLASYYGGNGLAFNFLGANLERKYGQEDSDDFGRRAVRRLKSWGFNTLGNWSIEEIGKQNSFPYVVALAGTGHSRTVSSGTHFGGGKIVDPFDPAFASAVDGVVKARSALFRNDPACIGYFYDNELSWGMARVDSEHYGLCYGTLSGPGDSPAKQAFVALLKSRYPTIDSLNAAWKTDLASWDAFSQPVSLSRTIASPAQRQDFSDFLTLFARKYFSVVSGAIKRYDPNHLYLGCRFAYWFTQEAVQAASRYVDVISFNIYTWDRDAYAFAENLNKPCLVGEFHFGSTDRGMFSGDLTVKDQQTRAESYASYVRSVLAEPAFVGCHWFEYYDEPTSGRLGDGENFNIGFLSITDTPYPELIDAARRTNADIYRVHASASTGGAR